MTLLWQAIGLMALMVVFILLWRANVFLGVSEKWRQMMDEMKKCSWPNWDELVGSTVLVVVTVGLLGGFTVAVDVIFTLFVKALLT